MSILSVNKVKKVFIAENNQSVIALDNLSIDCEKGEFLCILGSTGCGKTTLLRMIAGLEKFESGEILVNNRHIDGIDPEITMVFQQYSLFPWSTVIDNICFSWEMKGIEKEERYDKAKNLIELVGLGGFERSFPYELSGGMQQRAAIARALACNSQILLLDEPFGALDERTRHRLQKEILDIWEKQNKTIILVTHNIDEAIYCADRILVFRDRPGRIEEGIKINLSRPRERRSKEFIDLHIKIRGILENIIESGETT